MGSKGLCLWISGTLLLVSLVGVVQNSQASLLGRAVEWFNRARPKSTSPTNSFKLSFIAQSKKRSRVDPNPFRLDELFGLNNYHFPITPEANIPKKVDPPVSNLNTQPSSFVKLVRLRQEQAGILSKEDANIGLGASIKTGDYAIGRDKGVGNPARRQKKVVKLKCVKVGGITAMAHLKPMFMFPSVNLP
ncbi:hypothetical protein Hanom_Chr16g01487241 [Helianthus anomalus]